MSGSAMSRSQTKQKTTFKAKYAKSGPTLQTQIQETTFLALFVLKVRFLVLILEWTAACMIWLDLPQCHHVERDHDLDHGDAHAETKRMLTQLDSTSQSRSAHARAMSQLPTSTVTVTRKRNVRDYALIHTTVTVEPHDR
eukprot:3315438-Rhodomonas_salina.2